jgi:hypothetical protein
MNILKKTFGVLGILMLIYSITGRFIGQPGLGFGIIPFKVQTGILLANSLMLISLLIKTGNK